MASPPAATSAPAASSSNVSIPHALVVFAADARQADLGWLERAPRPYTVVNKSSDGIPNTGLDASTYLWWLLHNFDALPTWMLFMHLHEYDWHHPFYSQLVSMALDVDALGAGYLNIAHDKHGRMIVYNKIPLRELDKRENWKLREDLLGMSIQTRGDVHSGKVTYAPGAQFWVHKSRVLAHPRGFYERLYGALTDAAHPLLAQPSQYYEGRQLHNFFAEAHWHIIFGEAEALRPAVANYSQIPVLPATSWPSLQRRYACDTPSSWARRRGCTLRGNASIGSTLGERLLVGNLHQRKWHNNESDDSSL